MEELKRQEFNKEVKGESFIITLEYGMKEDKTNHILKLTITHVLDKVTGKKVKVFQDDITDLLHIPNVYKESNISMEDALQSIQTMVNEQIEMVINSKKNKESVENLLNELFKKGI